MSDQVEVVPEKGGPQRGDGAIEEPGKLLRIAVMLRELQEEVRRAPTDDVGRERLREVYGRAVQQLSEALSEDLREELTSLALPLSEGTPASRRSSSPRRSSSAGWRGCSRASRRRS